MTGVGWLRRWLTRRRLRREMDAFVRKMWSEHQHLRTIFVTIQEEGRP